MDSEKLEKPWTLMEICRLDVANCLAMNALGDGYDMLEDDPPDWAVKAAMNLSDADMALLSRKVADALMERYYDTIGIIHDNRFGRYAS